MKYIIKNNRDFKDKQVDLDTVINEIETLKPGDVIEVRKLQ